MRIGQKIKARRQELKLSADELGRRLNKDRSTIYRYEKGEIESLPLDILQPIAEALQTTPAYLMGWESEPEDLGVLAATVLKDDALKTLVQNYLSLDETDQQMLVAFASRLNEKKD